MAASEYLSTKSYETSRNPVKAAVYTGIAYVVTVLALILPYLLLDSSRLCLALTLAGALVIIALFNYYVSVARDEPFKRHLLEMERLSLSVAGLSFGIGYVLRTFFDIDV